MATTDAPDPVLEWLERCRDFAGTTPAARRCAIAAIARLEAAETDRRSDPRCPRCGFTMCELFDDREVLSSLTVAVPNGRYQCYHCTPITAAEAK